jgi:hypothetical protein
MANFFLFEKEAISGKEKFHFSLKNGGSCLDGARTQHNDTKHNDTHHNDTQHNDTQHNETQHNDTQHNTELTDIIGLIVTLNRKDIQHNDTERNDTKHNRLNCDTGHKNHSA